MRAWVKLKSVHGVILLIEFVHRLQILSECKMRNMKLAQKRETLLVAPAIEGVCDETLLTNGNFRPNETNYVFGLPEVVRVADARRRGPARQQSHFADIRNKWRCVTWANARGIVSQRVRD